MLQLLGGTRCENNPVAESACVSEFIWEKNGVRLFEGVRNETRCELNDAQRITGAL